MKTELAEAMFIQIGRKRYEVHSLEQASAMFCAARDRAAFNGRGGASRTPPVLVVSETGREVARISYNGRVWPPGEWHSGQKPLLEASA